LFDDDDKQQLGPSAPFCKIGVCLPPLGVSFTLVWDPRDQRWSHAGHTSVTQALTKWHESVESTEITLR
jgi:hypothetical protein